MMQTVLGGMAGLVLGLALVGSRLHQAEQLRAALAFRPCAATKTVMAFLGFGAMMMALTGYLAVLDVDLLQVEPLHGGTLLAGILLGAGLMLSGRSLETAAAGVGGGSVLESLATLLGWGAGMMLLPMMLPLTERLVCLPPQGEGTFFRVTLTQPYLWQGGFLGQGCLGAVLLVLAMWIPMPHTDPPREDTPPPPEPEEAEDTPPVIIALPEEEPLIIDDHPPEEPAEEDAEESPSIDEAP